MMDSTVYRWNVEIDAFGFAFSAPGFETENIAEAAADSLRDEDPVDNVEVVRQ